MIIVSQDKRTILNFEQISGITVSENGHIGITDNWGNDTFVDIGTYQTEKRAKEVLQEIIDYYSLVNYQVFEGYPQNPKKFEMPEN